jgi:hypothetical protein
MNMKLKVPYIMAICLCCSIVYGGNPVISDGCTNAGGAAFYYQPNTRSKSCTTPTISREGMGIVSEICIC